MTLKKARRLLGFSLTVLIAYCYGRVEASFGIVPLLFFTTVVAVCWSAGYAWAATQFSAQTALANRERDEAAQLYVELRDKGKFQPIPLDEARRRHPAGRGR